MFSGNLVRDLRSLRSRDESRDTRAVNVPPLHSTNKLTNSGSAVQKVIHRTMAGSLGSAFAAFWNHLSTSVHPPLPVKKEKNDA